MPCRIVTISRTLGAGGEEVGRLVAEHLGFRYADEEIIVRAAQAAGVSPESMARVEEAPGLIARILESMGRTLSGPEGVAVAPVIAAEAQRYEALLERVVREIANEGNVVIVAHGASIPLAGAAGLLRALVTAPPEVRAERVAEDRGIGIQEARKAVQESDRHRQDYLRRFYDIRHELPHHYDLVVNLDRFSPSEAAQIIATAAGFAR